MGHKEKIKIKGDMISIRVWAKIQVEYTKMEIN